MIERLARQARTRGDRLALSDGESALTWTELAASAARRAGRLAALGVDPGHRVLWEGRADADAVGWLYGILWRGASAVPVPSDLPPETVAALVQRVRPRALLASDPCASPWRDCGPRALAFDDRPAAGTPEAAAVEFDPRREFTLMRTSGTGGDAKLVPLRAGQHEASASSVAQRLALSANDRWLMCMPAFHVGGLAILFRSLYTGASVHLHPRFDTDRVVADLQAGSVTHASLVPTMLRRVTTALDAPVDARLRCVLIGGAPSDPALLVEAWSRGMRAVPTWGMTEAASQLATLTPDEAAGMDMNASLGLVGRPLDGVEIQAGTATEPAGLRVRGPMLFDGYFGASADQALDRDGWFTTGDRGYLDDAGRLYITGRESDRVISGGENVEPAIVESLLRASGLVRDAGVVGVPDDDWGQRVVAVVATESDVSTLDDWARSHLEPAQRPRRWIRVDVVPRGTSGKTRRDDLLRLATTQ